MTSWDPRANELFLKALELGSSAARAQFLDEACAGDPSLRAEVETLLEAHARAGSFLESRSADPGDTANGSPFAESPGTVIGSYTLLEQLGEGGFGVVFLAEQTEPVRRQVALKVLKPGMDTRQVVARFEAERQALALMDHPNIAHILDGGATASGRPYFVMELVRGIPVTAFCDHYCLPIRARLVLFVSVCQAVQHAHQKALIHRDLKPSNVLVTVQDGAPLVKVIDFGVAKALGQELTDKTLFTGFAQMIGTPLYMSPEQTGQSGLDIDTRSDIYSLGVVLYELLTGTTPFVRERFREIGYDEMRRIIREEEPPRPSTRISTLAEAATATAMQRNSEPKRLSRLFRGELDWVVMKALEKDRGRRYETASAFAADLQRYLSDEPVQACPPSRWYRFRKFARRNRRGLAMAAVMALAILVAVGTLGWFLSDRVTRVATTRREVGRALEESVEHQRHGRIPAALVAVMKAQTALASGDADEVVVQRVLKRRRDLEIVLELEDVRLDIYAVSNKPLGNFDSSRLAVPYARVFKKHGIEVDGLDAAVAGKRIGAGTVAVELAAALDSWAMARWLKWERGQRRGDRGAWQRLLAIASAADPNPLRNRVRQAFRKSDLKTVAKLVATAPLSDLPPPTILLLSEVVSTDDPHGPALSLLRRAQRLYPDNFWINHHLATSLGLTKPPQWDEAARFYSAALAARPDSAALWLELGNALSVKNLKEAEAAFRRAIELKPDYGTAYYDLGNTLRDLGRLDEAKKAYRKAIAINNADHQAHYNLGAILARQKRWSEALASHRAAARLAPTVPWYRYMLGQSWCQAGDHAAAARIMQDMLAQKMKFAEVYYLLGRARKAQGQWASAEGSFHQALQKEWMPVGPFRRTISIDQSDIYLHLGDVLLEQEKLGQAADAYREAAAVGKNRADALHNLGVVHARRKSWDQARVAFEQAIKVNKDYAEAYLGLGHALLMLKDRPGAITQLQKAVALKPDYAEAHLNLGLLLEEQGQWSRAAEHYRQSVKSKPAFAKGYYHLGVALFTLNNLDGAEAALRKAVKYDPTDGLALYSLGVVVDGHGAAEEAEKLYRRAIALMPEFPEAHCNLGQLLRRGRKYTEALAYLRKGHELALKIPKDPGKRRTGWGYDSARWVRECEQLVQLDHKLAKALKEGAAFDNVKEQFDLGAFCLYHQDLPVTAARFYAAALAAPVQPSRDVRAGYLFHAACAAALAGAGKGQDAPQLDEEDRRRWRNQAVAWLRTALTCWSQRLKEATPAEQQAICRQLERWEKAVELTTLRDEHALARLGADERALCRTLWAEVRILLRKVQSGTAPSPGKVLQGTLTRNGPFDLFLLTHHSPHKAHVVPLEASQPYLINLKGKFDTFPRADGSGFSHW
jgi:serine/threonine protein kinase/tetratricopeptide (TPR) repeat protein